MHMADALITPEVGVVMYAAAAGATVYSINKIRKNEDFQSKIPLMGVIGAFVFAAQMVNFSIPGTGSSGHIAGAVLLSALLGPEAAFISMISILLVQCLFFGDGGLLALGCNIINMGFFGCFIGYKVLFKKVMHNGYSKKRIITASILASVIGLECGAFCVVLETLASGITRLPFSTFVLFMLPIHLAIGIVEGIVTGLVLNFVYENRPDILISSADENTSKISNKKLVFLFLIAASVVAGGISLLASSKPDGLEWSILQTTGSTELENSNNVQEAAEAVQAKTSILPDYGFKGENNSESLERLGNIFAGIAGITITLAVIVLAANVFQRRKKVSLRVNNSVKEKGNERP